MGVTLEGEQGSFDPSHTHLRSKERCLEYRLYLKFFPVPYKRLPVVAEWVFFRAHCAYLCTKDRYFYEVLTDIGCKVQDSILR